MGNKTQGNLMRYGGALILTALAEGLRWLLEPLLGDRLPFVTLFVSVVFAARFLGRGPAILALAAGTFAVAYFLLKPRYSFAIDQIEYQVGLFLYIIVGFTSIVLFESLRQAWRRAEEKQQQLEQEISTRRAAEKNLAEREDLLRITFASIGDGVITTDASGRVTYLNALAQHLTGWTHDDARGKSLAAVFNIINQQSRQPVENPALRALEGEITVGLANHTLLLSKDGTERPIDDSAAPIKTEQGETVGVVLVFRDVTERRRIEQELQEADRRKDEFLATLAHELRNPLAPILSGLQLMRMVCDDPDEVEQALTMMERQFTQLVRLVDDLMDVSRISQGKIQLRRERVPLEAVINSAVESSRPRIEQMCHELTIALPQLPVVIDADPTRMAQVLWNLLNNAAKYTERGGHIWLTAARQGSDVVISVRDTGIGIRPDMLAKVFEMFTQADRALLRSDGGLGIGLTLVKRLVEMHGGSIEARSEGPGMGAVFVIRLPVVVEASRPQAPCVENPADLKSSLRILIVDDNRDGADALSMMLKRMGNLTRTAYEGEEAVAAAVEFRPDVILLDIGLPKLTGYEVCRRIREQPGGGEVVMIAQTGWGQEEDRQQSHEAGFNHHMIKPVDLHALMKLLAGLESVAR